MRVGKGNIIEANLVQEHSVRNQKELIRNLCANKSETAISTAAPVISQMCMNFDTENNIFKKASTQSNVKTTGMKDLSEINSS